jgi:hypothetical protein
MLLRYPEMLYVPPLGKSKINLQCGDEQNEMTGWSESERKA